MRPKFIFVLLFFAGFAFGQKNTKTLLFVGTYTEGRPDKGIYVYEFNSQSGDLKYISDVDNIVNPSFLTVSPNGRFLYACTDSKLPQQGNVAAFKIDSLKAALSFINKQSSGGENPVYLQVHKNNTLLVNANYTAGNVSAYKINEDGSLNLCAQLVQFSDSSVNKSRQDKSHVHAAVFSPDNSFIFFPDLGADKIRTFQIDTGAVHPLIARDSLDVKTIAGSGPRHFAFHPNTKFAYCIEELSACVSVYTCKNGKLDSIQRLFSYAEKWDAYGSADIHISPDGLFLYASNRGENENTLSIFSINQHSGQLKLLGHQSTFGIHPRNFVIDPSGQFLLVANLTSGNIVVFKRNMKTGLLRKTQKETKVPRPSCLQMRVYSR